MTEKIRMTRKIVSVLLFLILLLGLTGCGAPSTSAVGSRSDKTGASGSAGSNAADVNEDTENAAEAPDTAAGETESEPAYYPDIIAYGAFSEGKAFAYLTDKEPCYIDRSGNPVILLPEGTFGFPFSEGCAVLTDKTLDRAVETLDDVGPSACGCTWSLINEAGETVVPAGKYGLINSMSGGLCFAYRSSAFSVSGEFSFLDQNGNVAVSLDPADVGMVNENEIKNWSEIGFNAAGYCSIERRDYSGKTTVTVFDRSGAVCYRTEYPLNGIAVDTDAYLVVSADSSRTKTQVLEYGSFRPVVTYTKSFFGDPDCKAVAFYGDHTVAVCSGKYIASFDNGGTLLAKNELCCYKVLETRDGYLVAELANNHYGVFDPDLQLVFEPVKEKISCLGSGLFLARDSGTVYDATGDVAYSYSADWKRCQNLKTLATTHHIPEIAPEYSEGWCIIFDGFRGKPVYVNDNGSVAAFCTADEIPEVPSVSAGAEETAPGIAGATAEQAYREILDTGRWKEDMFPGEAVGDSFAAGAVYLYDIDGSGAEEMIVSFGYAHMDWKYGIYTYKNGAACYLGAMEATWASVYGRNDGTGICVPDGGQGEWWTYVLDLYEDRLCVVYEDSMATYIAPVGPVEAFPEEHWHSENWEPLPVYGEPAP